MGKRRPEKFLSSWDCSHHPVLISKIKGRGKAGHAQRPMESWTAAQHNCWQLCRACQSNSGVTTPTTAVRQMSNYRPRQWVAEPLGGTGDFAFRPPGMRPIHWFEYCVCPITKKTPGRQRLGFVHNYIVPLASSKSKLLVPMVQKA